MRSAFPVKASSTDAEDAIFTVEMVLASIMFIVSWLFVFLTMGVVSGGQLS